MIKKILQRLKQAFTPSKDPDRQSEAEWMQDFSDMDVLSMDDYDFINGFFLPHLNQGHITNLGQLDGFLTCVAIGPQPCWANTWFTALLGGAAVTPENEAHAEWLSDQLHLISCHLKNIYAQLQQNPPGYQPLLETHPQLTNGTQAIYDWCYGFMTASMLHDKQWESMLKKNQALAINHVQPIWSTASEAGQGKTKNKQRKNKVQFKQNKNSLNATQLKASVLAIHAYWHDKN